MANKSESIVNKQHVFCFKCRHYWFSIKEKVNSNTCSSAALTQYPGNNGINDCELGPGARCAAITDDEESVSVPVISNGKSFLCQKTVGRMSCACRFGQIELSRSDVSG